MSESDSTVFGLHQGTTPLLVSLPHIGTLIPVSLQQRLLAHALAINDTDWFLDQLYDFVHELGASMIVPTFNRYVIDLNRSPEDTPMYIGANNTELCPTHSFSGEELYRNGQLPTKAEIETRTNTYWRPYHEALGAELARLKSVHGHAVLFDAHSIKSTLPWLFDGTLPDLNLGTAGGASCAASLRTALSEVLRSQTSFSQVVDGRFKGGYITRHYGQPHHSVHAVQLEMCFHCYLNDSQPYVMHMDRIAVIKPLLRKLVNTMLKWTPDAN